MKISLSLISVGMIAAAASAGSKDMSFYDYTGSGLQSSNATSKKEDLGVVTLFSTDFNSYTTGVVCTDLTATTQGQGGWWAYSTGTNTTTGNTFSIVTNAGGKGLKSQWGSATSAGSISYLWQDANGAGFNTSVLADSAGETRITQASFDLTRFTNTVSTNKGQTQLRTYDASGTFTQFGFIFDNYATGTNPSIRGLAYLGGPGVTSAGTYAFTLVTGSTLAASGTANGTTKSYYCDFNQSTNRVEWGWSDVGGANATGYYFDVTGYQGGTVDPSINEMDFLNLRNTSTTAGNMVIDNVFLGYQDTAVPAPGAVALVGLAGIAARRRRA